MRARQGVPAKQGAGAWVGRPHATSHPVSTVGFCNAAAGAFLSPRIRKGVEGEGPRHTVARGAGVVPRAEVIHRKGGNLPPARGIPLAGARVRAGRRTPAKAMGATCAAAPPPADIRKGLGNGGWRRCAAV